MAFTEEAFESCMFTSPCCHAFNTYSGSSIICSECGKTIGAVPDEKELSISVRYNEHNTENVSGDVIYAFRLLARRFAEDPTYELCSVKCPKCNTYSRYARDPQGNLFFICSNTKCRFVFDSDNLAFKEA